jgi:uncharacterized protein (UPF0548 family)
LFIEIIENRTCFNKKKPTQAYISFPQDKIIDKFLKEQIPLPYSYPEVGASKTEYIKGYDNDHNKILLGKGEAIWKNAKDALLNWQQFPQNWTTTLPNETPLKMDETVAVFFRLFGLWWMNAARIVYTLDDNQRFGFAYGTLRRHVEYGEECFWIEKEKDGSIYYHIRAFSKPRFWLVKIGYPIARAYQRKFVRQSMQRMRALANQNLPAHV